MIRFLILVCGYIVCGATTHGQEKPLYWSDFFSSNRQHARAAIRHIERGGIGYNHGYTTFETFLAPDPDEVRIMPFLDARGHLFDNGKGAANIGVGLRSLLCNRVYGANVYYDFRNTQKNNYNQVGFGLETLGKRWDFRANGYVPVGRKISCPFNTRFSQFSGNNIILAQQYQFAMAGANVEFGVYFGKNRFVDFYAAAGPYYFTGTQCVKTHIWGGKIRFICRLKEFATFEFSDSYDKMFKNRFQFSFTLTMPFGSGADPRASEDCETYGNSDVLPSRMTLPVVRQEIIVVGCGKKCTPALDPATGLPFTVIFVDNTSHSAGTFKSPYPTLLEAQENSKSGDIIYVFPGDGTTQGMNQGITLQLDQRFWGSGVSHALQTVQGNILIPALSTSAPIMTNTAGNGITLAARNQVSGFVVSQTAGNGINGTGVENLTLSDCTVEQSVSNISYLTAGELRSQIYVGSGTVPATNTLSNLVVKDSIVSDVQSAITLNSSTAPLTCTISNCELYNNIGTEIAPVRILSGSTTLDARITNNYIHDNECGGIRCIMNETDSAQITINNNNFANNSSGTLGAALGSTILIDPNNLRTENCAVSLAHNTGTNNSTMLYCFDGADGSFGNLSVTAKDNIFRKNLGGGIAIGKSCDMLNLNVNNNIITQGTEDGVITIGSIGFITANINISHNQITGNSSGSLPSAINIGNEGTTLNANISNNNLSNNDSSGITMYPSSPIQNMNVTIANNTINNNQNANANLAGGIAIEQFKNLSASITNNTVSNNVSHGIDIGTTQGSASVSCTVTGNTINENQSAGINIASSTVLDGLTVNAVNNTVNNNGGRGLNIEQFTTLSNTLTNNTLLDNAGDAGLYIYASAPTTACTTMVGNTTNTNYTLDNNGGTLKLAPCNAATVNTGTILTPTDPITLVESCTGALCS